MKVHVIPIGGGEDTHHTYIPCWCSPLETDQGRLFIHHASDLREVQEWQGRTDADKKWIVVEVDDIFDFA